MNVYDSFFRNITDENWEFFATDVLSSLGFTIIEYPSRGPDGGKDSIVEREGIRYIVSCKHFYHSDRAVGVSDEESITDRIKQHDAQGFIGFYSTLISSSLSSRMSALEQKEYKFLVYDMDCISDLLHKIPSGILQKYGLPNDVKFVMNVAPHDYLPLNCLVCEKDILGEQMINISLAQIVLDKNGELRYLYGCKKCISHLDDLAWLELIQGLHQEQFLVWVKGVDDLIQKYPLGKDFYKNKSNFESRIIQRMYPSNWGRWLNLQ